MTEDKVALKMYDIFKKVCEYFYQKQCYIAMLAKRGVQGELWFQVEMMKLFQDMGLHYKTEKPHGKKPYYADFMLDTEGEKSILEVKARALRNKSYSMLTKRETQDFDRLSESKEVRYKWSLIIAYPCNKSKLEAEVNKILKQYPNISLTRTNSIPIDENTECVFLLFKV